MEWILLSGRTPQKQVILFLYYHLTMSYRVNIILILEFIFKQELLEEYEPLDFRAGVGIMVKMNVS